MPKFKVQVTETEVRTTWHIIETDSEEDFYDMPPSDLGEPVDEDVESLHDPEITYWEEL